MNVELVSNGANERQVRRARHRVRDVEQRRRDDLEWQLSDRRGRRFVWFELIRHRLFESITVQSSLIYAASGRRDAGLELLAEVQQFPRLFLLMQQEAMEDAAQEQRENAAAKVLAREELPEAA